MLFILLNAVNKDIIVYCTRFNVFHTNNPNLLSV